MMFEHKTVRVLYKKLLALYPRVFRERFGESMEQTFNDLCNERKQRTGQGFFGFVLRMFAETAVGITKEHILLITEGNAMKNTFKNLRAAAIISLILVLPFAILELVNRRNLPESFPIPLFGILWLLPMAFIVILAPIVRNVPAGNSIAASPINLLLRIVSLAIIAIMWGVILIDQTPCFLGVPNCD